MRLPSPHLPASPGCLELPPPPHHPPRNSAHFELRPPWVGRGLGPEALALLPLWRHLGWGDSGGSLLYPSLAASGHTTGGGAANPSAFSWFLPEPSRRQQTLCLSSVCFKKGGGVSGIGEFSWLVRPVKVTGGCRKLGGALGGLSRGEALDSVGGSTVRSGWRPCRPTAVGTSPTETQI